MKIGLTIVLAFSCVVVSAAKAEERTPLVSIIRLIANPEPFYGKKVRVLGFVTFGFEDRRVWLAPADHEAFVRVNSIPWVGERDAGAGHQNGYAIVEGVFRRPDGSSGESFIELVSVRKWIDDSGTVFSRAQNDAGRP